MLGLRTGDLNASRSGFQIRLSTSTTHPALWILLNEIFGRYGRVGRSAALSRGHYEWATYCYLDSSFEFLLEKCKVIPEDILTDEQLFLAFLAGYVDAEGSLRVYEVEGTVAVSLRINSEDERILRDITRKLKSMGYHVDFALMARRGLHRKKRYHRNLWSLGMFRREEVGNLLRKLPLRHSEKTRAAGVVLSIKDSEWERAQHSVNTLKSEVLSEVDGFVKDAMHKYLANHRA